MNKSRYKQTNKLKQMEFGNCWSLKTINLRYFLRAFTMKSQLFQ